MLYYKQNAAAISSMMVKTIEEEEAEKALKKTNKVKGKTAATSSTNVQSIMEPQKEEVVKEFMSLLSNQQIDALCCICKDIYFNSSDRNRDVNHDDQ